MDVIWEMLNIIPVCVLGTRRGPNKTIPQKKPDDLFIQGIF